MFVKRAESPTGEGWVHYQWPEPGEKNSAWKSTFIKRAIAPSGKIYLVGSGKYNLKCERIFIVDMVDQAISLLEKEGLAALDIMLSRSSEFIFQNSYIFVKDNEGFVKSHLFLRGQIDAKFLDHFCICLILSNYWRSIR